MYPANISEKKGTWFAVISGLLYGFLGYFGITLIQSGISVYNLSFWRFLTSFVFLSAIYLYSRPKNTASLKTHVKIFCWGALFYSVPSILFFVACRYIGSGQAMVIFFVYPAFVMVLNWLFDKKPIKPHYFLSFGLILCGLIFLVDLSELKFDFLGILLSLLSALSYAIYVVLSKKTKVAPLNATMMVSLGCMVTSGFIAFLDNSWSIPAAPMQWLNIVGIAVLCSALPILLLLESMKYISSDKASLLSVNEPLFTVFFGVLLLGEVLHVNHVIGMVLTLCGAMTVMVNWGAFSFTRLRKS